MDLLRRIRNIFKPVPKDLIKVDPSRILEIDENSQMLRDCPECNKETLQTKILYDPDDPESAEVWNCTICLENIEWVY